MRMKHSKAYRDLCAQRKNTNTHIYGLTDRTRTRTHIYISVHSLTHRKTLAHRHSYSCRLLINLYVHMNLVLRKLTSKHLITNPYTHLCHAPIKKCRYNRADTVAQLNRNCIVHACKLEHIVTHNTHTAISTRLRTQSYRYTRIVTHSITNTHLHSRASNPAHKCT